MQDSEPQPPDPTEAYAAFSPLEIKRLQRYVDRVRAFERTDFARLETISFTLSGGVGTETTATVSGLTDQVLKQALMELRPLWLQDEAAGFQQSQALVKRHAYEKGTDAGRKAIEHVKNHTRYLDSILNGPTPIQLREIRVAQHGQVVSEEEVAPRRIFEDFLNGIYFHEDEERIARIGAWLHSELQRYIFANMVHDISHVYRSFATIVEGILAESSLRLAT
jgi:hypothetical protein